MKDIEVDLDPYRTSLLYRGFALGLFAFFWVVSDDREIGAVLLLFLFTASAARWRQAIPGWTVVLDQLACLGAAFFWPGAVFGLALPLFDSMLLAQPWLLLPLVAGLFWFEPSLVLIALMGSAGITGWLLRRWVDETEVYKQEADLQRRDRYELEKLKTELLVSNVQVSRLAELGERNRLAQELHDDVGHELTGAVLALQAFEPLWREDNLQAETMFEQAKQRLNNSALRLRQTAHNIKPVVPLGMERIEEICANFQACPLILRSFGDSHRVPAYIWNILEACLKEGLTNAIRHAQASEVSVVLDINPNIVRLQIENDGVQRCDAPMRAGMGLRHLRQRAQAVGGSVSTDADAGFRLICVLPSEIRGDSAADVQSR